MAIIPGARAIYSTVVRTFALHAADFGLILRIPYGRPRLPGIIIEMKIN